MKAKENKELDDNAAGVSAYWDRYYEGHQDEADHRTFVPDLVARQHGSAEYQSAVLAGATSSKDLVDERRAAGLPSQASVTEKQAERYKADRKRALTATRVRKHRQPDSEQ